MSSPIQDLVTIWRDCKAPPFLQISEWRERLYAAAHAEIALCRQQRIPYDPMRDQRFQWASQWLNHHEDHRNPIDPETDLHCRLRIEECPSSIKHIAAGDR
jgi:hypothetical protein